MNVRIEINTSIGLLRLVLALLHLGMCVVSFIRPHMIELIGGYARFGDIAPTTDWGWYTLIIGLGLLLLPRASPLLIVWQAASATLFALFAILATAVVGLNWGTVVYGGLSLASAGVAYVTADGWFTRTQVPQRFRAWLQHLRRARHG